MAVPDNSYSRVVAWLKILLPLTALGILSSLFLVSQPQAPVVTQLAPDQIASGEFYQPHVTEPSLSGVTQNGSTYTLHAKRAVPNADGPDTLTLSEFAGTLTSADGLTVDISAPNGLIQSPNSKAILTNGVRLVTSDGYLVVTQELHADLANTTISSPVEIKGTGPVGSFSADQMILRQQYTDGSYELVFKGGVKVIYLPGN